MYEELFDYKGNFIKTDNIINSKVLSVNHNNLEMVQLLVKHGDKIVKSNKMPGLTNSAAARQAGNIDIADYLDQVQTDRFKKLLEDADKQALLNADKDLSNPSLHAP